LCNDRHGAEEVEPSASGGGRVGRSQAFQGRAYRLGDSEATSEVISSAARLPDHPQVNKLLLFESFASEMMITVILMIAIITYRFVTCADTRERYYTVILAGHVNLLSNLELDKSEVNSIAKSTDVSRQLNFVFYWSTVWKSLILFHVYRRLISKSTYMLSERFREKRS